MLEMQLSWQQGFSLSRKPTKRSTQRRKRQQRFEFIEEDPQIAYHPKRSQYVTTYTGSLSDTPRENPVIIDTNESYVRRGTSEGHGCPMIISVNNDRCVLDEQSPELETMEETIEPCLNSCNTQDQSIYWRSPELDIREHDIAARVPNAMALTETPHLASIPPTIEYNCLTERFKPMLSRYNTEFCTIPLTFHLRINPFRYRTDIDPEPSFLVHAVMALAGHHVKSTSTLSHRHAALQLLRQSLEALSDAESMYSMLDTIIILFSLDETQSLLGNWSTHLVGAYTLLEACGGVERLAMSSRIEAQIGILTWWDAVTSLLSREDCVFPYAYFDAVLYNQHKREWDFFGLCGCPTSLTKIVMQLARLGSQQKRSFMQASVFDNAVISDIEESLESWCHIPAATALRDEEFMHQDQEVMHCSEAWRNGLLLYIFRVFRWRPGDSIPIHIFYRARVIVDHITSSRDANMTARQALFPLFLAGCELRDRLIQKKILKLCSIWDERTRYHMFRGAIPLLEEVWTEQETRGFENVWWGQVVDKQHSSKDYPLKMRLCFG